VSFIILASLLIFGIKKVSIDSPVQQQVNMNKDLMIDIAPPPLFLIEAYLRMSLLNDTGSIEAQKILSRIDNLEKIYRDCELNWIRRIEIVDFQQKSKFASLQEASNEFIDFYHQVYLKKLGQPLARSEIDELKKQLTEKFGRHNEAILVLLDELNKQNVKLQERSNIEIIKFGLFLIVGICFFLFFYFVSIRKIASLSTDKELIWLIFIIAVVSFLYFLLLLDFFFPGQSKMVYAHWIQVIYVGLLCSLMGTWLLYRVRKISSEIIEFQEKFRRKVAWELHDGVLQVLGSALFRVKQLFTYVDLNPNYYKEVENVSELLKGVITDIRRISHEMRPAILDHLGLASTCRNLIQDYKEKTQIRFISDIEFDESHLPFDSKLSLFRIIQEIIQNIEKHSKATEVIFSLKGSDKINLTITDNGVGFNSSSDSIFKSGIGFINIRERVKLLNGSFSLNTSDGNGVHIEIEIPVEKTASNKC
jgi:signal transduction histidine kinase